jgi:hypothetical protein
MSVATPINFADASSKEGSLINFADFAVFADMYNDTEEKWNIHGDDALKDVIQDGDDALKDYYDAYCSYLVSRKYTTDVIKTYRKNAIIDFYITENKFDNSMRKELDDYYVANIKDNFNKKLEPPACFFHQVRMEQKDRDASEKREIDTDDVAQHYINLKNMYKRVYDLMNNTGQYGQHGQHAHHNLHTENTQSDCGDADSNYDKYLEYYDEYYNLYDSDYYTEHDNYSDGFSDDYENHDY